MAALHVAARCTPRAAAACLRLRAPAAAVPLRAPPPLCAQLRAASPLRLASSPAAVPGLRRQTTAPASVPWAPFTVVCKRRGNKNKRRSGGPKRAPFVRVTRDSEPFSDKIPNATLVPVTEAKKLYCLTEADLNDLPYDERDNPHGSSVMRLYNHGHLKRAALAKYGSAEGLAAKKQRNEEIAAKARATRAANKKAAAAGAV